MIIEELPLSILLAKKHYLKVVGLKVEQQNECMRIIRIQLDLEGSLESLKAFRDDLRYAEKYEDAIDKILQ